ncbi:hypothetical protein [Acinetobacter junii]|uniref:hypothetical protein n=1 Tax=Acinetobacter junii TaxID=40215 RepID=UPI001F2DA23D|nr:hypothetical protein [Acinetobacter junii]
MQAINKKKFDIKGFGVLACVLIIALIIAKFVDLNTIYMILASESTKHFFGWATGIAIFLEAVLIRKLINRDFDFNMVSQLVFQIATYVAVVTSSLTLIKGVCGQLFFGQNFFKDLEIVDLGVIGLVSGYLFIKFFLDVFNIYINIFYNSDCENIEPVND